MMMQQYEVVLAGAFLIFLVLHGRRRSSKRSRGTFAILALVVETAIIIIGTGMLLLGMFLQDNFGYSIPDVIYTLRP
jgi:hypothetical protein